MVTTESGSGKGRGLRRTALTMPNMAVLAPIPSVSIPNAAMANPGLLRRPRTAYTKSLPETIMRAPSEIRACGPPAVLHPNSYTYSGGGVRLWDGNVRLATVRDRWRYATVCPTVSAGDPLSQVGPPDRRSLETPAK